MNYGDTSATIDEKQRDPKIVVKTPPGTMLFNDDSSSSGTKVLMKYVLIEKKFKTIPMGLS